MKKDNVEEITNFREYVLAERRKRHKAWMRNFLRKLPSRIANFLSAMIALLLIGMSGLLLYITLVVIAL